MSPEAENTFRALREEPLNATRQWWCRFGFHRWTVWSHPNEIKRGVHTHIEQYRCCNHCGMRERRQLLSYW
jgi:DNA-binding transcriptional regulator PaaX